MNNINYFKLKQESEALLLAFRKLGYQCRKKHKQVAYKLLKEDRGDYTLIYLPSPVDAWEVMPNDGSPNYQNIAELVKSTLDALSAQVMSAPVQEDYSRPWAIVRLLPDARRYTIARFFNRQDAHDHRNFLCRYMAAAEFEIIFDVPNHELTATSNSKHSN